MAGPSWQDRFKGGLKGGIQGGLAGLATGNPYVAAGGAVVGAGYGAATAPGGGGTDEGNANREAGESIGALSNQVQNQSEINIGRALDQTLPEARAIHSVYEDGGALSGDTNLQSLYNANGQDPAAMLAREEGERSIGNALAARGMNNSGRALRATGNLNRGIIADQYLRRMDLAGRADEAQNTRFGGFVDRTHNLGAGRGQLVADMSTGALHDITSLNLGGINATLAGAGADAQGKTDTMKAITSLAPLAYEGWKKFRGPGAALDPNAPGYVDDVQVGPSSGS